MVCILISILFEINIFNQEIIHSFILRTNIFLKNTVDTNPRLFLSYFNAAGCRLWSTGSDRSQSSVLNGIEEEPSEIAVVEISRTEYIMKFYDDMVHQIPRKRILWRENPLFTSVTSHLKFAHERCVTSSEHKGTPA